MKKSIIAIALAASAGMAQAQPMGPLPYGFELSGEINYSFVTDGTDSDDFAIGWVDLGYRHELNSDLSLGVGVRGLGVLTGGFSSEFGLYAYIDYRDFRLSYGAIDNAAQRFDWDFSLPENTYFSIIPVAIFPISLNPLFTYGSNSVRVDGKFGNVDVSASYSIDSGLFALGGQTSFGNTRVLAFVETPDFADGFIVTVGAHHDMGALDLGVVATVPIATAAPFDWIARFSVGYEFNERVSAKLLYVPDFGALPFSLVEASAAYDVNEFLTVSASVTFLRNISTETLFGLNANIEF